MLGANPKHALRFNATTSSRLLYLVVVVVTALVALVSNIFIFSQAVRTAPSKVWTHNGNVIVIGAAYVLVLFASLAFCLKRRFSVRLKLARIPKGRIATGQGDLPKVVHTFIEEEFLRSCATASASLPIVSRREGWGVPGTKYEGVRFRTAILDTVSSIDTASRAVIPSMSPLSPRVPLAHHLRHLLPLLTLCGTSATHTIHTSDTGTHVASISSTNDDVSNEGAADMDGPEVYFRRYTAAVELAKYCEREMSEVEFEEALEAAGVLKGILHAYKAALHEQQSRYCLSTHRLLMPPGLVHE